MNKTVHFLLIAFGLAGQICLAGEEKEASKVQQTSDEKGVERVDLNKVDFEQMDQAWENTPKFPNVEFERSPKIKEILEPSADYNYASFGRADPFSIPDMSGPAFIPTPGAAPIKGDVINATSKLQVYPISDLVVKGYWRIDSGEARAVVVTPRGEGAVVKVGDPISSGKVLKIEPESMLVRLYRIRSDGLREYEDVTMKIGFSQKKTAGRIRLEPGRDPIFERSDDDNRPARRIDPVADPLNAKVEVNGLPPGNGGDNPVGPGAVDAPQNALPAQQGELEKNAAALQGVNGVKPEEIQRAISNRPGAAR